MFETFYSSVWAGKNSGSIYFVHLTDKTLNEVYGVYTSWQKQQKSV